MPMRHVTLRQLQVFEAAARLRSFSRAAAELHLTQPGISMQIRELEGHVGVPLFERIGRAMHLTEAGGALLRHTNEMHRALKDAEETLDALRGLRTGRLHLGVTSTAKYFAPRLLARFRDEYPGLALQLTVANRETVIEALAGNAVDLAIMGRSPRGLDTVAAAFAPHPFVIIAAPDHPLARRRRIPVGTMATLPFLVREPGSGTRSAMQRFLDDHGIAVPVAMEMASNETIKQAVMAGMGVSFLSQHTIALELASRRLIVLDVQGLPVMREWFVVHLAAKLLSPTAQAFYAFVRQHGSRELQRL